MKNAAGILFNENTELIVEADPDGTVTSCRNLKNNTEYVGGGGGSSDFSTAEVTYTLINTNGNAATGIGIVNDTLAYLDGISVQDNDTISYVLYKGSQEVEAVDVAEITVSGNATILDQSEDDGVWWAIIEIIGDCIIHLTGSSDI